MKAIIVLFDSLRRDFLPPYGNDWVHAPNFSRLAKKSVTFNRCYVGSMPCMPARRELHTGRSNFLHRAWGPLEPFDDSMPQMLRDNGTYTHLTSDHGHYWEDGGCTYHTRYSSWELARGQEGDPWKGEVADPEAPDHLGKELRQDWINRKYWKSEDQMSQTIVFDNGVQFLDTNASEDNWLLQVECFDPHPPFVAPERFRDLYPSDYDGPQFDFPPYRPVSEEERAGIDECRRNYAALVSKCDKSLGRVMDAMDAHNLWDDTMLIVTTDHGFMLGEHDWWCFVNQPFYNTTAHKPLFIWDPRSGRANVTRDAMVQMTDVPATLMDYFGMDLPRDMEGYALGDTIKNDTPVRDAAMFGVFGGQVNVTDGRYVYMRAPTREDSRPLYNYTHMPTHMHARFSIEEMRTMEAVPPLPFTKGCPVMRIEAKPFFRSQHEFGNLLFDMETDFGQESPLDDPEIEAHMVKLLIREMIRNHAPSEQYTRLGLPQPQGCPLAEH
jgi:arylsulfatase A-like enzyme